MNRSAYKYDVEMSFVLNGDTTEINPSHIQYILIDSDYENIFMPVIYMSISVNADLYSKLVDNEKEAKVMLRIRKYNVYSQNKLTKEYLSGLFTYLTSNSNPNYTEDLSSSDEITDTYSVINLALMSMEIINKEKVSFNGVYKDIDQSTLIAKAFEGIESVISPIKYNPTYTDTIFIPPLSSIHKYIYYLYDLCPFYDTNYLFFIDFNRAYLLDRTGNYCPSNDGQMKVINISIESVLNEESYYEGMEERDDGYYININPANISVTLNRQTDKIINQLVYVDDEGDIQKVDIDINPQADSSVKQTFIRGEHAKLYMNILNATAVSIQIMKENIDSAVITPNKMVNLVNNKDHSVDGSYVITHKKELIKNVSGTFNNSLSIGLRKVEDILPLRKDVEAKAVYSNSTISRRKNKPPAKDDNLILTNSGIYIKKNG